MTIISINIANILIQYFGEKVSQIEEAAAKQNESNTKMVAIADNISDEFEKAMTMLNELEKSIDISHSSMGDIADSTESTAEATRDRRLCVLRFRKARIWRKKKLIR